MKNYTEMDINKIYLVMGLKCNFNCKYCYEKGMVFNEMVLNNEVIDYIKRLHDLKPFVQENPIKILFWGGEPLLYLDTIKEIVAQLKGYNFTFSTVSNGFLFTDEIVEYFNENNIGVAISNDGVNTKKTRNIDVLATFKANVVKKLNQLAIDSVVSGYNYNYLETIDYVSTKLDKEVPVAFEWLHCTENTPKDLYNIDYDKYSVYVSNYFDRYINRFIKGSQDSITLNIIQELHRATKYNQELVPKCGQMRTSLNIDLQGNIMACHPSTVLGDIHSDYDTLIKKYDKEVNQAFSYCDCSQCEYLMECKAGCPLEVPCEGKLAMCEAKKIYYRTVKNKLGAEVKVI